MLRRTLIFLPLLICLALWLASYLHPFHTRRAIPATPAEIRYVQSADLDKGYFRAGHLDVDFRGFNLPAPLKVSFLGFRLTYHIAVIPRWIEFDLPLWAPTVLTAALALLLWRKKKRKPSSAFPIEPTPTTATVRERQQNPRIL